MCVITICESKRETLENMELQAKANSDGVGIMWRSGKGVRWVKNLTVKQAFDMQKDLPFPYAIHFRIATVGNVESLTHPFPIIEGIPLKNKGLAPSVLMHNGHWGNWKDSLLQSVCSSGATIPLGEWSDSRAMAYLAQRHGNGILSLISSGQKIVVLSLKDCECYGEGWTRKDGKLYSNLHWEPSKFVPVHYDGTFDADKDYWGKRGSRYSNGHWYDGINS